MMKKMSLGFLLLLICTVGVAKTILQIEPASIQEGEVFKLTLTLEGDVANSLPNFNPLEQDFTIAGTQRSISYSLINGKAETISQWTILLMPKKKGVLSIPPLQVGKEFTLSRTVEVLDQSIDAKKFDHIRQDLMLLSEVDEENPLVNQQVIYTVKFYNSHPRLINATYQPPQVEDALLIPIGNGGRRYQTFQNGNTYTVIEQQYALFPQKSGPLKINPPSLHAVIDEGFAKKVNLKAKSSVLNIKAVPDGYEKGRWLPAKALSLKEQYDNNLSDSLKRGDTLTRTIEIEATALPGRLLPKLEFPAQQDISVYPEPVIEKSKFFQGDIVGKNTIKVNYLFNESGSFTIPELRVKWFNTKTGKEEESILPARKIEVLTVKSENANDAGVKPNTTPTKHASQLLSSPSSNRIPDSLENGLNKKKDNYYFIFMGMLIGIGACLIISLSIWSILQLFKRKRDVRHLGEEDKQVKKNTEDEFITNHSPPLKMKLVRQYLQMACLNNNPKEAKDALIQWASLQWPKNEFFNLSDIENLIADLSMKQELNHLKLALYSKVSAWEGEKLWDLIKNFKLQHSSKKKKIAKNLPEMHHL